jgi:hypothetical protein
LYSASVPGDDEACRSVMEVLPYMPFRRVGGQRPRALVPMANRRSVETIG